MTVNAALQKLDIVNQEIDLFVLQLALQYSGGKIASARKPRKKPGTGGRPVLAGRMRKPVIQRHFEFANAAFYPPLTEEYARRKERLVGMKPMLVFTGTMRGKIVNQGIIKQLGKERARITWLNVPFYTKYQEQHGRDPVAIQPSDMARLKARATVLIKQAVRARLAAVQGTQAVSGRVAR